MSIETLKHQGENGRLQAGEDDHSAYSLFQRSVIRYPDNIALKVGGSVYRYGDLEQISSRIVSLLSLRNEPFVGLYARKSLTTYAGILGVLAAGSAYVPLSPRSPALRNETIRQNTGIRTVIVGPRYLETFIHLAELSKDPLRILLPETGFSRSLAREINARGRHELLFRNDLDSLSPSSPKAVSPNTAAYLLFTSGSTGYPKGVPVSHGNLRSFMETFNSRYDFTPEDRISQSFEPGFDPSIQDIFTAWSSGAGLYCVPESSSFLPGSFINRESITVWHSVPSIARLMKIYGKLREGSMPTLRYSMFGGEPLYRDLAMAWSRAAPDSVIDNLYGPTEITITISGYRWDPRRDAEPKSHQGVVSIGKVFANHDHVILNENPGRDSEPVNTVPSVENAKDTQPSDAGELAISGPQVVCSYYRNPAADEAAFFRLGEGSKSWYRTGDVVVEDEEGDLFFLHRRDEQIKVRGNRIEPGEILHVAEEVAGSGQCTLLPVRGESGEMSRLVLFLLESTIPDDEDVLAHCRRRLPDYMIPDRVQRIEAFPLTDNGKLDRTELQESYEESEKYNRFSQVRVGS